MINQEIGHYPFKQMEDPTIVRRAMGTQYRKLLDRLSLSDRDKSKVLNTLYEHFIDVEGLGLWERNRRLQNTPGANLHYHNLDHFYQTGFDATAIAVGLRNRQDHLSDHLSTEGLLALPIAGIRHDIGYITANPYGDNLAAHTPIHVAKSMQNTSDALQLIPFPEFIDNYKLREFAIQGQHNTHFPWTPERATERRAMLMELPAEMRKEAMIIRLAVQLADLGGQTIRVDQHPVGALGLRAELEATLEGLGIKIMGTDDVLLQNAQKFNRGVVIPSVGKTAKAFFGKQNIYSRSWEEFNQRSE